MRHALAAQGPIAAPHRSYEKPTSC
jgi:hypothetical protein